MKFLQNQMNIFLFMSTMHWNVKYLLICPAVSEVGRRNTKEKTFYFIQAVPRTLTKWISHYCLIKMVGWNQKNSVVLCSCPSPLQASFPPSCHPSLSNLWFWRESQSPACEHLHHSNFGNVAECWLVNLAISDWPPLPWPFLQSSPSSCPPPACSCSKPREQPRRRGSTRCCSSSWSGSVTWAE